MNRTSAVSGFLFAALILILPSGCGSTKGKVSEMKTPIVTDLYTADPSAHVFEGKLYVYPSHDIETPIPDSDDGDSFDMKDYHVYSFSDMKSPVKDHGAVLKLSDIPWASKQLWAPDAAFRNGKYYLYFPAKDKDEIFRIGVAVSDSPSGPFKPESRPIEGGFSIDPAVFVDDDGTAYMYFGGIWGGQLQRWTTGTYDPAGKNRKDTEPALGPRVAVLSDDMLSFKAPSREVIIQDEHGRPLQAWERERRFFEGTWMHKYDGKYYLSYSTGDTHYLVYAVGDNPLGPFTFKGKFLHPVEGWTTHHSIVRFQEKWYLFYHDSSLSGGKTNLRCVKFQEFSYNPDGTIPMLVP